MLLALFPLAAISIAIVISIIAFTLIIGERKYFRTRRETLSTACDQQ
jgi:hypothetical protein